MRAIYEWIENIAFYSVLLVLVTHLLPAGDQKKYVRFFMGLVFMLVVFGPILRLTGQEDSMNRLFIRASYEQELKSFQMEQERLEQELEIYVRNALENGGMSDGGAVEQEAAGSGSGEAAAGSAGESGREDGQGKGQLVEPVEIRIGPEEGISP